MYETVASGRVVPPKRHLKLENVLLQALAIELECGVLRRMPRAFCNDPCHIYYVWNAEPDQPSGRRLPQRKFVVWVHDFAGTFVYPNVITHGCACIHKWSRAQTITVTHTHTHTHTCIHTHRHTHTHTQLVLTSRTDTLTSNAISGALRPDSQSATKFIFICYISGHTYKTVQNLDYATCGGGA